LIAASVCTASRTRPPRTPADLAAGGGDDPGGRAALQAVRRAHGEDRVPDAHVAGGDDGQGALAAQARRIDAQDGQVGARVAADDARGDAPLGPAEAHGRRARAVDDVRVGDDVAAGVDEERRADRVLAAVRERRVVRTATGVDAGHRAVDAVEEGGEAGQRGGVGGRGRRGGREAHGAVVVGRARERGAGQDERDDAGGGDRGGVAERGHAGQRGGRPSTPDERGVWPR
jgi:hypothetical protein